MRGINDGSVKSQITNSKQFSNSQLPKFKTIKSFDHLRIGILDLFGIWKLVIGISSEPLHFIRQA
jgi:hypothetical protein